LRAVLAALLIAALTLGCAAPAPQADSVATAAPALATAAPTVVASWNTFAEPVLGYTLSYPSDTMISSGVSPAGVYTTRLQFRVPGVDGYQGMLIRAEPNPKGRGLEAVVAQLCEDYLLGEAPADLLERLPSETVAGLTAAQIGSSGDFSLVLPIGDFVYIIAPVHNMTTTGLDPRALELFYQVLATLKVQQ
jgi:hypothetical protein